MIGVCRASDWWFSVCMRYGLYLVSVYRQCSLSCFLTGIVMSMPVQVVLIVAVCVIETALLYLEYLFN